MIPILIASSFQYKDHPFDIKKVLFSTLTAIIQPLKLHFELVTEEIIRKKILCLGNMKLANTYHQIVGNIGNIKKTLTEHSKLQLSIETVYQLMGTTLLLSYSYSKTKTRQGLAALFEQEDHTLIGITMSSRAILVVIILLNVFSLIRAYYGEIVKGYNGNYNFLGKLTIVLCILCNSIERIMSMVLYFSPTLGLFNLLHHYQG